MSRPALLRLVLSFLFLPWNPGGAVGQGLSEPDSVLYQSHWTGSALGRSQAGEMCWVSGPDGALRLEILFLADNPERPRHSAQDLLDDLLHQRGHGYCLVLGEGADGTFNAWGEPWQRLDTVVARWLIPVSRLVAGGHEAPSASFPSWREISSSVPCPEFRPSFLRPSPELYPTRSWEMELPALERLVDDPRRPPTVSTFRSDSVKRALGRGGSAEILRLTFSPGPREIWYLTTSRKPGRLELAALRRHAIRAPGLEVFTPLWPLADLLIFDDK